MKFNARGLTRNASLLLLLSYFLTFLLYYFANHLFYEVAFLGYLWAFVQKATYLLLPILAGLIAVIVYSYRGVKAALVSLIPTSLSKIIYFIPYYYLMFIYDYFDSGESLLLGFIVSLAEAIASYVMSLAVFFIIIVIVSRRKEKSVSVASALEKKTLLDFSDPVSLSFALISLVVFLYVFGSEISATVTLIRDSYGSLKTEEIIYTVVSYIYDALLLVFHYLALSFVKNKVFEKRLSNSEISE
ncbi:MAG: hypothetical protein IJY23_08345 [Clostridia bacterium]|nr:hypothetical protein [Clostridia bacterium]